MLVPVPPAIQAPLIPPGVAPPLYHQQYHHHYHHQCHQPHTTDTAIGTTTSTTSNATTTTHQPHHHHYNTTTITISFWLTHFFSSQCCNKFSVQASGKPTDKFQEVRTEFRSCLALATCVRYLGGPPCIMTSSCAAGWETPQRTDSTACECAKLSRAGGLRGTTELQHTYVLTSHKPGIYSPAPNTNATMDTTSEGSPNAERTRSEHGPNAQLSVRGKCTPPRIIKNAVFTRN